MSELNQAITNSLNTVNASFTDIAKFVEEQAPSLFQELITWNIFESVSITTISLGFIVATLLWDYKLYQRNKKADSLEDLENIILLTIFGNIFTLGLSSIFFFAYLFNLLKAVMAPKVWLVEYIACYLAK